MKKRICVLTATRAEYGLLRPVVQRLREDNSLDVQVVVTGAHLSPEFGLTYKEIENDGIPIDKKIEILLSSDTPASISKSMGLALIGFADYFAESRPDMLVVLGDRYETLAVCCAAMNQRIPIAHLHGGEATEGAVDEAYRHAISKLSYLHFTSTEAYRTRVIQLGEDPSRVFNVGALGVENILRTPLMSREDLERSLNTQLSSHYVVVTHHPVTLEDETSTERFQELLNALDSFPQLQVIFTKANADTGGRNINTMIDEYVKAHGNAIAFESLGMVRYLSAVKHSCAVLGNSSSGIIEVPSLGIPTINIGDRQKGRIMAESVISCKPEKSSIENALTIALSNEFKDKLKTMKSIYGDGNTSSRIIEIISKVLNDNTIDLKKAFYDL